MSSFKMQSISHSEYLSGKYKNVSSSSGNHEAKVWYKDNGAIDEDSTYSDSYLRSNGLGRYAKKAESSSKSSSGNKSSSSGSSLFSSSSKKSSSSSTSSIKTSYSKTSTSMGRELTEQEIEAKLTNERLGKHITNLVNNCCDIYDKEIIEKTQALGEELGLSGDEAISELNRLFKRHYDPEFIMKNFGRSVTQAFDERRFGAKIPTGCRKALLHYMRCAISYEYLKKGDNIKEWMKKLKSAVSLHYSNDNEVQELYAEIENIVKKRRRRTIPAIILGIIAGIIFLFLLLAFSLSLA